MKQRILDALFLLAMLLLLYGLLEACSGHEPPLEIERPSRQFAKHSVKPRFLFFSSPGCPPCVQFDHYCQTHPAFMAALRRRYVLVPAYKPQSHPAEFARYKITRYPTFIATDSAGNELARMVGWKNNPNELLRQLSQRKRKVAPPVARDLPPVITEPPVERPAPRVDDRVAEINERLQRRLKETEDALKVNEDLLKAERRKQTVDPAKERQRQRQVEALQDARRRAEAEAEELRERLSQPVAPDFAPVGANAEKEEPKPEPEESPKRGIFRSVFHHSVRLALELGLSQAQAEVLVPVVAGGGPVGAVAGAGFMLFKAWRRRKKGQRGERGSRQQLDCRGPTTVVVDSPALPGSHRIDTQFVNIESDNYRRAHEQARQTVARRYPGSQEVLEAELHLTNQFLAGQE